MEELATFVFFMTLTISFRSNNVFNLAQYFPGMIATAIPNEAAYDIDYDDGDHDDELPQRCVLPFEGNVRSTKSELAGNKQPTQS